jgi:hypothetical protein
MLTRRTRKILMILTMVFAALVASAAWYQSH